jgi:hypothetical protein
MLGARAGIVCRERLRVLLPILVGVLLTACASGGVVPRGEESELAGSLMVQNRSWKPVTVYIAKGGQLWRLGTVDASRGRSFSPDQLSFAADGRDAYLVARPPAGDPFRSEAFTFSLGRATTWTIENAGAMSRLAVR